MYGQLGSEPPDVDDPAQLRGLVEAIHALIGSGLLLAYHDRSDGGLLACVVEMAFAGGTGVRVSLDEVGADDLSALFSEELGAVLQIRVRDLEPVLDLLSRFGLEGCVRTLGRLGASHGKGEPEDEGEGDRKLIRHVLFASRST